MHVLTNDLKRIYEKDKTFIGFNKFINELRKLWSLSVEKSGYLPPKMRFKLRFANIFSGVNWAVKMLEKWETLPHEIKEKLSFLDWLF